MASLKAVRALAVCGLLWLHAGFPHSQVLAAAASEVQVKAVFLFNFSHFVQWPDESFRSERDPFIIGVLGAGALAAQLDDATRGEKVGEHALQVRRYRSLEELGDCHILFIDRSESARLAEVLARLDGRATLTVSDLEGASRHGVMIQFATQNNRVRLLINVDAARAAGLTISSNLLRPAEIVRSDP